MIPLLLLHGALGSAAQFQSLSENLPGHWPIYALNFPGHGGLPPQEPFSMALFSEAVLHFLAEHQLEQVNVFGYSMGGYIALGLAAEYPTLIHKIVTLGTKLDWSPEVAAGMSRMFDPEKIHAKVPAFGDMLARTHAPADWKMVCQYTTAFLHDLGNGNGLPAETFSKIACPVTIGRGELDNVVTMAESQRVAQQIPQGKFQLLENTKHPIEQADIEILTAFLIAEFA